MLFYIIRLSFYINERKIFAFFLIYYNYWCVCMCVYSANGFSVFDYYFLHLLFLLIFLYHIFRKMSRGLKCFFTVLVTILYFLPLPPPKLQLHTAPFALLEFLNRFLYSPFQFDNTQFHDLTDNIDWQNNFCFCRLHRHL